MTNGTASGTNGITSLAPCPLCGKKVSIARTDNEQGERWWFVTRGPYRTTRCNCRLFLESEKFTCGWNDDYALECRRKLIERWNTRVAVTDHDFAMAVHDGELWRKMEPREPEWEMTGGTQTQEFWECSCAECCHSFGVEDRSSFPFKMTINKVEVPNFCPDCGTPTREVG